MRAYLAVTIPKSWPEEAIISIAQESEALIHSHPYCAGTATAPFVQHPSDLLAQMASSVAHLRENRETGSWTVDALATSYGGVGWNCLKGVRGALFGAVPRAVVIVDFNIADR